MQEKLSLCTCFIILRYCQTLEQSLNRIGYGFSSRVLCFMFSVNFCCAFLRDGDLLRGNILIKIRKRISDHIITRQKSIPRKAKRISAKSKTCMKGIPMDLLNTIYQQGIKYFPGRNKVICSNILRRFLIGV